jgi:hypothetical protein
MVTKNSHYVPFIFFFGLLLNKTVLNLSEWSQIFM